VRRRSDGSQLDKDFASVVETKQPKRHTSRVSGRRRRRRKKEEEERKKSGVGWGIISYMCLHIVVQ
jgi:hypothetical protein